MLEFSLDKISINSSPEEIVKKLLNLCSDYSFSTFALGITFPAEHETEKEAKYRQEKIPLIAKEISKLSASIQNNEKFDIRFLLNFKDLKLHLEIKPVYIEGRYNKYSRSLPQTIHYCYICKGNGCKQCNQTGKLSKSSVQEYISDIAVPAFGAKELLFHGSGREDVDVRMLGKGRPFVIELIEPKIRSANLKKIENSINKKNKKSLKLTDLVFVQKKRIAELKSANNRKKYSALVKCENRITVKTLGKIPKEKILISQHTPERVVKRRTDLLRKRNIQIESYSLSSPTTFNITLIADQGLYIKEFISGDNERTNPSLSSILSTQCICKELDVLDILD